MDAHHPVDASLILASSLVILTFVFDGSLKLFSNGKPDTSGAPIDLTGYTIIGSIKSSAEDTIAVTSFVTALINAQLGSFSIGLSSVQTALLINGIYVYDIILSINGILTKIIQGKVLASPEVTDMDLTSSLSYGINNDAVLIVEIGIPGPSGPQGTPGVGYLTFATTALMFAYTPTTPPAIAYCTDAPDQYWKWSIGQNTWVPASI